MSRILVTGAAGFIGMHVAKKLLEQGSEVVGLDNLNPYYDVSLKEDRLSQLKPNPLFRFEQIDLADRDRMAHLFATEEFEFVVHLGAQAGVRHSITNPHAYIDSNIVGFMNVLEGCRHVRVRHLVFASSSSVYGSNDKVPFSVADPVDHPVSLYAATKKANELMAHSYSHLYAIPVTGLRFFTVYGPWGRPDMAYFKFTESILKGKPIEIYNYGKMQRDFTYIDDIVEGVLRILGRPPQVKEAGGISRAQYRIYNIGNNRPVELMHFVNVLETCLGKKAVMNLMPLQAGDVLTTHADVDDLIREVGFQPDTPIETGLARFVEWYCRYYGVSQVN